MNRFRTGDGEGLRPTTSIRHQRRGAGADHWGRSLELPVADPAAAQIRRPEVPMHDR